METPFLVETEIIPPSCFNSSDGSIAITELEAIAPFTIEWSADTDDDRLLENLFPDTYTLTIVDGGNCVFEESFDIIGASDDIIDCSDIFIPNIFSPNNDGFNDIFSVFFDPSNGVRNVMSLQVYNRWGSLMFEQNDFLPNTTNTGWDGDFNGEPLNFGVYLYITVIRFDDGRTLLLSGDITLVR